MILNESQLEFISNIGIRGDNECWLWKGRKDKDGYGIFMHERTHRIMYELVCGPIPKGLNICHNCPDGDNSSCCNPFHLWAGTQKENIQDAMKKGRMWNKEQRKRNSDYQLGKPLSEESKKKIGEANKQRIWAEESRRKSSESAKRSWARKRMQNNHMDKGDV